DERPPGSTSNVECTVGLRERERGRKRGVWLPVECPRRWGQQPSCRRRSTNRSTDHRLRGDQTDPSRFARSPAYFGREDHSECAQDGPESSPPVIESEVVHRFSVPCDWPGDLFSTPIIAEAV